MQVFADINNCLAHMDIIHAGFAYLQEAEVNSN
jgi:hypothetical protein